MQFNSAHAKRTAVLDDKVNKKQTDTSSTEQTHGVAKPYDRPAVERFVPPNFDRNFFLAEHKKKPNAASRLISNPFTYPVALIGNILGSIGRAVGLTGLPDNARAAGNEKSTSCHAQRTGQHGSGAHAIPTEEPDISEKIGIVFIHGSSAPRYKLPAAWVFRAFYLPVEAARWPLVSIRGQRESKTGGCNGVGEDLTKMEKSGEGLGLGSAILDVWTRMKVMLSLLA